MRSSRSAGVANATTNLDLATVLRTLGDPARLEIVRLIADGEMRTAGRIAEHLDMPASTCSYHLKQLLSAGITECHAAGTARCPVLRREHLEAQFPGLLGAVLENSP